MCPPPLPLVSGGPGKGGGEDPAKSTEQEDRTRPQILSGSGICKWFNVRMGFGFISMTSSEGGPVDPPLDVFVHQVSLKKRELQTFYALWCCDAPIWVSNTHKPPDQRFIRSLFPPPTFSSTSDVILTPFASPRSTRRWQHCSRIVRMFCIGQRVTV